MRVLQRTSQSVPPLAAGPRRRGVSGALRGRAGLLVAGLVVLVAILLVSSVAAPQAQAKGILGTGISIPNPLSPILGGLSSGIVGLAVKAFEAIIKALFTPLAKFVTVALIGWLTAIPNFAQGHVAQLEQTVAAICGGVLGAVATISVIRYWLAGFAGGGDSGFSALEGLVRTVGAALFIAIWPWLFQKAIGLANLLSSALLGSGTTVHDVAKLLEAGLAGTAVGSLSGIGLFLGIAIAVAASLLFLGLLLLKIVVSVSTILLFVGMPFAAVLWPITPWIARLVGRAFAVCLAVPVLWALCVRRRRGADGGHADPEPADVQRKRGAEHAALAAGGDRAAVRDAETPDSSLAGRDARRGGARRRVRVPGGELRGGLADARCGQAAPAGLARWPVRQVTVRGLDGRQAAESRDSRRRGGKRRRQRCRSWGRSGKRGDGV